MISIRLALVVLFFLATFAVAQETEKPAQGWPGETKEQRDARMKWWREARFGMFIHWGAYSHLGGVWNGEPVRGYAEHIQRIRRLPAAVYRDSAVARFDPTRFDADAWVATAKRAGMGYMIVTAKHHDGFAMYDSKVGDYDVVQASPWHRDPMRALRDAARRQGLRFGFYYSHAFDWEHPDAPGNDWDYQQPGGDKKLHGAEGYKDIDKQNILTFRIQPDEGIKVRFFVKTPGADLSTEPKTLRFHYADAPSFADLPSDYERLIQDAFVGDQSACLVARLMTPPAPPRPKIIAFGPFSASTDSTLYKSR